VPLTPPIAVTALPVVVTLMVAVLLVVVLLLVYWYANRLKRRLDTGGSTFAPQPPVAVRLSETAVASLAHLSQEPILLKQAEDGTRVQIDDRPLVLLSILTDKAAAAALREIVADVSQRYGVQWTALVTSLPDGSVRVQRLA